MTSIILCLTTILASVSPGSARAELRKVEARASTSEFGEIIDTLSKSETGRSLLRRAQAYWNLSSRADLSRVLRWGRASRTDAVLTRKFDPETGRESRERQVTIYLREGQSVEDLVFDIAHELVHATTQPNWDPYDASLTAARYVSNAIEGEGGEVEAVLAECRVGLELGVTEGASAKRCRNYLSSDRRSVEREKVLADFYRVGRWAPEVLKRVGSTSLPHLSSESPRLFSSTGQAPYPVALIDEYDQITEAACANTRKRIGATKSAGRSLASTGGETPVSVRRFLNARCP